MLVEDDHSISEMVDHNLTKEGFEMLHAYDGEEGIRLIRQDTYDIILHD
ncbi:DNA-binding response regulator, partial [Bacillus vallismortis]|nr:DNA-binding response regulator [Bacillus vallismortis]